MKSNTACTSWTDRTLHVALVYKTPPQIHIPCKQPQLKLCIGFVCRFEYAQNTLCTFLPSLKTTDSLVAFWLLAF